MKPKDFSHHLNATAELLENLGDRSTVPEIVALARMFDKLEATSVAAIIKQCDTLNPTECSTPGIADTKLVAAIRSLAKFITHSGKKPFAQDLDRLAEWLSKHRSIQIPQFVQLAETAFAAQPKKKTKPAKSASPETIELYLQLLDETYGFETSFDEVYSRLKADGTMKVPQLKKLAKLFAKATTKSRDEALKAIYGKHSNIVEVDRHRAARGERVS